MANTLNQKIADAVHRWGEYGAIYVDDIKKAARTGKIPANPRPDIKNSRDEWDAPALFKAAESMSDDVNIRSDWFVGLIRVFYPQAPALAQWWTRYFQPFLSSIAAFEEQVAGLRVSICPAVLLGVRSNAISFGFQLAATVIVVVVEVLPHQSV